MAVVDDVREALEQTVPDFSDRSGDWAGVLAMAQAGEEDRPRSTSTSHSRRRQALIALTAAVLVLVVGTASAFGVRDLLGGEPHVQSGAYPSEGKRGSFNVWILFMRDAEGDQTRGWRIGVRSGTFAGPGTPAPTGQYVNVTGRGRIVRIGGHAQAWSTRLEGFVTRPGEAKQRVVITMKGRPKGVFVLTPVQPGVLKRDSGTQTHTGTGG